VKITACFAATILALLAIPQNGLSLSLLPRTVDQQIDSSAAIFRGTVVSTAAFLDSHGHIRTRIVFKVDEVFKGAVPNYVRLEQRGGVLGNRAEMSSFSPRFKAGEQRLVMVGRRSDGTLYSARGPASAWKLGTTSVTDGNQTATLSEGQDVLNQLRSRTAAGPLPGADVTGQADSGSTEPVIQSGPIPMGQPQSTATNLMTELGGIPERFLQPDRGEPIPYWIDADYLPAGMTLTQAVTAVQTALAAWTNVTSLRYKLAGILSFGMGVCNMTITDGGLYIQLHDHYGCIEESSSGDILGVGGNGAVSGNSPSGWTLGGNVAGNDFNRIDGATVVLQHTNVFMENITNFEEVLCHEIGHTLGLEHSSENPNEPNPLLSGAIMYYMVHGNGRGATLNAWDINVVRQVHPPGNTPPWCYSRVLDAITSPQSIPTPGVNTVQVPGFDLQSSNLTFAVADSSTLNGSFSASDDIITYTPSGWYSDSDRLDPAGNAYWDIIYARYSDGTNASPYATVRVVSLLSDTYSEGIPDRWRLAFFGSEDPSAGPRRHAGDDFDGDGFSNLTEWWLGSNPTNPASNLQLAFASPGAVRWQAKGYELYELYGSTDLVTWARAGNLIVPTNFVPGTDVLNLTNSIGSAEAVTNGAPREFFRAVKVH
jgi:Matrixin